MKAKRKNPIVIVLLSLTLLSCEEFLDAKPSKTIVIPNTIEELEGLLNDNAMGMNKDHGMGHLAVDDIQLTEGTLIQLIQKERNAYLWDADPSIEASSAEWFFLYKQIYNANMVVELMEGLEESERKSNLRGKALFVKAQAYFFLLQEYCMPYQPETAMDQLGIPLRDMVDVNILTQRSTLKEAYDTTEGLLLEAAELMEEMDISRKTPSKWAAFALLSRLYLVMGEYDQSLVYADKALGIGNELIDYNLLDFDSPYPFPEFGTENIYNVTLSLRSFWTSSGTGILPELYNSYDTLDLRKYAFFMESPEKVMVFKGSYSGNYELFAGLATDELYLNKAECHARLGDDVQARTALGTLLEKRYAEGVYSLEEAGPDLLDRILLERRKELVFRNIRWIDMRRFSTDPSRAKEYSRVFDGEVYHLKPGGPGYAFPIPMDEVRLNGLQQNPGYE